MRVLRGVLFALAVMGLAAPAMAAPPVFNGDVLSRTVPTYNVKAYGAKGDGTTDDSAAINNTITAAAATCGIVLIPAGTFYLGSAPVAPASCVWIMGSGITTTILKLNGALTGGNADGIRSVVPTSGTYLNDVHLSDFTVDATAQTVGNGVTMQGFTRLTIERVRVLNPFGFGFVVGTVAAGTPYSTALLMNGIYVDGERNGNDSIGGGGILRGTIQNYYCTGAAGTVSDLTNIQNFTYRNVFGYRTGTLASGADGIDSDYGALNVLYDGIYLDGNQYGMVIAGGASQAAASNISIRNFTIVNSQKGAILFNSASGKGPVGVDISEGYIASWDGNSSATPGIVFQGGSNLDVHDVIYGAPTVAAYAIRLQNDGGGANPPTLVRVHDNDFSAVSPNLVSILQSGAKVAIRGNIGYNPIGAQTPPSIPASTTALTNPFQSDMTVNVTGGTVTAIAIGGTSTGLTSGSFRVPVGQTITLTYSVAPTWTWFGD